MIIELYKDYEKKFSNVNFNSFHDVNLIIIGTNEYYNNLSHKNINALELIENDDYDFNDLDEETQNQLLKERTVLFQGKLVLLNYLIKSESFSSLKSNDLETLIKMKSI